MVIDAEIIFRTWNYIELNVVFEMTWSGWNDLGPFNMGFCESHEENVFTQNNKASA